MSPELQAAIDALVAENEALGARLEASEKVSIAKRAEIVSAAYLQGFSEAKDAAAKATGAGQCDCSRAPCDHDEAAEAIRALKPGGGA